MKTNEFLPNIRCPHCEKAFITPISGFGREKYNSRQKQCGFCKKDFVIEIFVSVSKESIADIFLSGVENDIKYFRKKKKRGGSYNENFDFGFSGVSCSSVQRNCICGQRNYFAGYYRDF